MDEVAKELKVRNRIINIFNKLPEDFDGKEGWDDYLETIEDIVYCLVNNVDVQQAEARVSDYERSNRANIIANQARKAEKERVARAGPAAAAAAEAAAAASTTAPPQGFVPSSLASTALGRLPMPVQATAQDSNGSLMRVAQRLAMGSAQEQAQAAPAGWSPDMPRLRAMQEAFGSLLVQL